MKAGQWTLIGLVLALAASDAYAADMGTAFTYQGFLEDGGGPLTDSCDFEFSLWDADAAGTEKGNSPQSAGGKSSPLRTNSQSCASSARRFVSLGYYAVQWRDGR